MLWQSCANAVGGSDTAYTLAVLAKTAISPPLVARVTTRSLAIKQPVEPWSQTDHGSARHLIGTDSIAEAMTRLWRDSCLLIQDSIDMAMVMARCLHTPVLHCGTRAARMLGHVMS